MARHGDAGGRRPPQSNQRGIETEESNRLLLLLSKSLNRTSVGLKHLSQLARRLLQERLNRTSVGLKQVVVDIFMIRAFQASIEPAWD